METQPVHDERTLLSPRPNVVQLPAEIDLAVGAELRDRLLAGLTRDGVHLVVDARKVTFMDSTGINALVRARERAELMGGSIHVVSDSRTVRRLLEITQLTQVLHLVAGMDDALECLRCGTGQHSCSPAG
jgi:anti-anti-sigma factor